MVYIGKYRCPNCSSYDVEDADDIYTPREMKCNTCGWMTHDSSFEERI